MAQLPYMNLSVCYNSADKLDEMEQEPSRPTPVQVDLSGDNIQPMEKELALEVIEES